MAHFRMDRLARYESAFLGAVLVTLAIVVVVFSL
jgi:hypothetical protein